MIPRMWTQERFSWKSDHLTIPEREVVPKPLQRPHPPLWQTSNTLEGSAMAGSLGVGLLATTLLTPLSSLAEVLDLVVKEWELAGSVTLTRPDDALADVTKVRLAVDFVRDPDLAFVPEPSTALLVAPCLAGLGMWRRRAATATRGPAARSP